MGKYGSFIIGIVISLLLLGAESYAVSADHNFPNTDPIVKGRMMLAYQEKRRPVQNSLIRPSENHMPSFEKTYQHNQARDAVRSGQIVSLSVILAQINQRFPGKIIDVRLLDSSSNRPYIYRFKVLQRDGKLLMLELDAKTAQILSVKGK